MRADASAIDYEKFKSAFRAAVDAMRSVAPNIQIDFTSIRLSFGKGPNPGSKVMNAYPGDQWVDYIGVNVYDQGPAPESIGVPPAGPAGGATRRRSSTSNCGRVSTPRRRSRSHTGNGSAFRSGR